MYPILTEAPKQIEAGKVLVSFSRKSTSKNPVAESDKYRAVVVPSYKLPVPVYQEIPENADEGIQITDAQEVFQNAIAEVFMAAASSILLDFCTSNKEAKEISEDALTFEAVVAKMEASQTSQRLNQEQIFAWYDASETAKDAAERYKHDANKMNALRTKFGALASNNSGINAALATKMISYVNEKDTSDLTAQAVLKKLERLTKESIDADEL